MSDNAIQILRTKLDNTDNKVKDIVLSGGQPFFNITTNKLYVGDGNKEISKLKYVGQDVDDSLQDQIDTEAARAQNKESELQTAIDSEVTRSTTFDESHNNIENNNNGSILKNSNNDCSSYKSFLYGDHLTATANYQAIFGQYNNISSTALLAVGGGTSDESKNLFEVNSTGSKFNTKLEVSEKPAKDNDVLRWQDLTQKQVSNLDEDTEDFGGDYLTGVKFVGNTLRFAKSPLPALSVTSNNGDIVVGMEANKHAIQLIKSSLSGGKTADQGYYISKVVPKGLEIQVEQTAIPEVSVASQTTDSDNHKFIYNIQSNDHEIQYFYNKRQIGESTRPVFVASGGDITNCSFSILAKDNKDNKLNNADIIFYVGA